MKIIDQVIDPNQKIASLYILLEHKLLWNLNLTPDSVKRVLLIQLSLVGIEIFSFIIRIPFNFSFAFVAQLMWFIIWGKKRGIAEFLWDLEKVSNLQSFKGKYSLKKGLCKG